MTKAVRAYRLLRISNYDWNLLVFWLSGLLTAVADPSQPSYNSLFVFFTLTFKKSFDLLKL